MTAVQWWCSGVMLDRIFRPSHIPERRYDDLPLPEMRAATQDPASLIASSLTPAQEAAAVVGILLDQVA